MPGYENRTKKSCYYTNMPTYDYKCKECGHEDSVVQSISAYCSAQIVPNCHGPMERKISVVPSSGLSNVLAGDRYYDGLRASDGTDISSRTKHREYMKRTGLTTADDFKGEWKKAEERRREVKSGTFKDKELRAAITEQVHKAIAN